MKLKPILAAMAVAFATIAQPAVAEFTHNAKGEVTHHNGIPLPPIPTIEEARAQAEKNIAATKAEDAEQAQQLATRNPSPAAPPQEVFFTGKPYIEETGQYAFLFRHYDLELSRWTTADPSGFPDGANNYRFLEDPLSLVDPDGLAGKKVAYIYAYTGDPNYDTPSVTVIQGLVAAHMNSMATADQSNPNYRYVSDGDYIDYHSVSAPGHFANFGFYDFVYIAAHGIQLSNGEFTGEVKIGGNTYNPATIDVPNLAFFDYCGANGQVINSNQISSKWFHHASLGVAQHFYE